MSRKTNYTVHTYTIPAGEYVQLVRQADFVTCLDATGPFKIQFEDGSNSDFEAGLSYSPADGFYKLTFFNPGADPVVIRVALGTGAISDARVTLGSSAEFRTARPDALSTGAPKTVSNGSIAQLAPADALRAELLVVSPVGAGTVYIGGDPQAGAGHGLPLQSGQSMTLNTGAAIYARNDTGAAVALSVASIRWSA